MSAESKPPVHSKSADFIVFSGDPLNGAPVPAALRRGDITPLDQFFVRNHADAPAPTGHNAIQVTGLVKKPGRMELDGFPRTSVEATLQCAGNRRCGLIAYRPIPGEVAWSNEAIGNAIWDGVGLATVLDAAGVTDKDTSELHVWFTGSDTIERTSDGFGGSIPFAKAMSPQVILADAMNGAPLTRDHGAPLRAIVPGYIGARSIKWLREVRVEREPSPNHFQQAYSFEQPGSSRVLGPLVVNSAFALPDHCELEPGAHRVCGWAIGSGDSTITRVEVSSDGGRTWREAQLTSPEKRFVWRLWEVTLSLPRGTHELACRAFDSSGAAQPANVSDVWNAKGYVNNSWHRVRVAVAG